MAAVYKREIRACFQTMTGYIFTAIVMLFIALNFWQVNLTAGFPYFAGALSSSLLVFVLAVPILTMRTIAEEKRWKTDQLLLTYPVSVTAIILGKFFAMMTVFAIPLVISCLCPIVISSGYSYSFLIDYSAIFAYLCLGCMFVAIGIFVSSLTESPFIAAVGTMGAILALCLWSSLVAMIPETAVASLIGFLALAAAFALLISHVSKARFPGLLFFAAALGAFLGLYIFRRELLSGLLNKFLQVFAISGGLSAFTSYYVFDVRAIILFLSVGALFVFLTVQSVRKRQWN